MKAEIWKDAPGYEGRNLVSNLGNVFSVYTGKNMPLKHLTGDPYLSAVITKNNKSEPKRVHRLVAMAFLENLDNKPCVNHKDGVKTNNSLENLEWATYKENSRHLHAMGLGNPPIGARQHMAVLTDETATEALTRMASGEKAKDIAKDYQINQFALSKLKSGKTWKHLSFDRSVFNNKPTPETVKKLCELRSSGRSFLSLEKEFGLCRKLIKKLLVGNDIV